MQRLFLDHCLLPGGWVAGVALDAAGGVITAIEAGASPVGRLRIRGIALPGLPNLHCHAFQRGMAGLAERRSAEGDSFWTWRDVMYRFLERLTPEDIEAIAAFAYMEMLERGFTSVVEFHYLHHDPAGRPYTDVAETSGRIARAAAVTGIGLTLLPALYAHSTFGGVQPLPSQRRFVNDLDRFLALCEAAERHLCVVPDGRFGIAPHSLRAVTPETLAAIVATRPAGPIHIHAAEQAKEVADCLAWSGRRPVEWLLDEMEIDGRWCLVHATHMTPEETQRLARSGAVVGLCPMTEANLGDGIFDGVTFRAAGGRFGIGTDSQIETSAPGELKQLEYSQRLRDRARNRLAERVGASTGRSLYEAALAGGAQASGRRIGAITPGCRADFVVLDEENPDLASVVGDGWLDGYVFVAGASAVRTVFAGGECVVQDGRHRHRTELERRFRAVARRMAAEH